MIDETHLKERLHAAMLANSEIADALSRMESKLERVMKNLAKHHNSQTEQKLRAENAVIDALKQETLAAAYEIRLGLQVGNQPETIEKLLDWFDASNARLKAAVEKFSARLNQFLGS